MWELYSLTSDDGKPKPAGNINRLSDNYKSYSTIPHLFHSAQNNNLKTKQKIM